MGVLIKVTGGNPVYSSSTRIFDRVEDARLYLARWGITHDTPPKLTDSPRVTSHRGLTFILSHAFAEVLDPDTEQLADTPLVSSARLDRRSWSTRGTKGDESRKHDTPNSPATPQPRPATRSSSASSFGHSVTLKQLCDELKLDPSKARAKLRKAFGAGNKRYEWPTGSDELAKVREVLS